jgi:hypothetical protein
MQNSDPVNKPAHYTEGRKYEPIKVIRDWNLGFSLGNAVKYISRAGRKDPLKTIEDLKKAIYYIQDEINVLSESEVHEQKFEYHVSQQMIADGRLFCSPQGILSIGGAKNEK